MKTFFKSSTYIVSGFLFALMLTSVSAWTGPTQDPPGGNTPAPLNAGSSFQTKTGSLQLGAGTAIPNLTLSVFGSAIIDTLGITDRLVITSGNPAPGKVLSSIDAAGTVAWVVPAAGEIPPPPVINPEVIEFDFVNGTEDVYSETSVTGSSLPACDHVTTTEGTVFGASSNIQGGICPPALTGQCIHRRYTGSNGRQTTTSTYLATCRARQAVVSRLGNTVTASVTIAGDGVPTLASGSSIATDAASLNKICQLRGYQGYYTFTAASYVSPGDNQSYFWSGTSWVLRGASSTYLNTLTCYRVS